jgi:hypothetical protein
MISKNNRQVLEGLWMKDIVGTGFRSYILDKKMEALQHGAIIPDDFLSEMERFKDRNTIVENGDEQICCVQCLKAYALKKADEIELGDEAIRELNKMLDGGIEVGHNGYYMDAGELVKIDED